MVGENNLTRETTKLFRKSKRDQDTTRAKNMNPNTIISSPNPVSLGYEVINKVFQSSKAILILLSCDCIGNLKTMRKPTCLESQ